MSGKDSEMNYVNQARTGPESPPPAQETLSFDSPRFGELTVPVANRFVFTNGIPGFPGRQSILLFPNPGGGCFEWLHSMEKPSLALAVIEPEGALLEILAPAAKAACEQLGWDLDDEIQIRLIVTVPGGHPERSTVNTRAPALLNRTRGVGAQPILNDESLPLRVPLFPDAAEDAR